MTHCCGTCKFWCPEGTGDFRERCKSKFRESYCRLSNEIRYEDDMKGCLAWKQAEDAELVVNNHDNTLPDPRWRDITGHAIAAGRRGGPKNILVETKLGTVVVPRGNVRFGRGKGIENTTAPLLPE